jgi:hypothetical protein
MHRASIRLFNGVAGTKRAVTLARQLGVDPAAANPAALYALRLFGVRTVLIGAQLLMQDGGVRARHPRPRRLGAHLPSPRSSRPSIQACHNRAEAWGGVDTLSVKLKGKAAGMPPFRLIDDGNMALDTERLNGASAADGSQDRPAPVARRQHRCRSIGDPVHGCHRHHAAQALRYGAV